MHSTNKILPALLILAGIQLLTACGSWWLPRAHKIDIQQGNILQEEAVAAVTEGMSRPEVLNLLGSPVTSNRTYTSRWDYIYSLSKAGDKPDAKRLTLFWQDGRVTRIEKEGL